MRLKVLLPTQVVVDERVARVRAEAENGSFTLLPRHIDFVAALTPGILSFNPDGEEEQYLAIDEGILVKRGPEVLVSTRNAVRGPDLEHLREAAVQRFTILDEHERKARTAIARLEASFVRRYLELGRRLR